MRMLPRPPWFVAVLLVCQVSLTTAQQPDTMFDNLVRVYAAAGNGSKWQGSGVYLGDRLVLTACHVINQRGARSFSVRRDRELIPARIALCDTTFDLALLELSRRPAGLVGCKLATADPKIGDRLYVAGLGGDHLPSSAGAHVIAVVGPTGRIPTGWLDLNLSARDGDSGGPALNQAGELVGVLWGSNRITGRSTVTTTSRTREFLSRVVIPTAYCFQGRCVRPGPVTITRPPPARTIPVVPVQPQPTAAPRPSLDKAYVDRLVQQQVEAWLERNVDRLKGADGINGIDGNDGRDASIDAATIKQLAPKVAREISRNLRTRVSPVE